MNRSYLKYKGYAHFDKRMSVKQAQKLLSTKVINEHGFFPFIHFEIKTKKLDKSEKRIKAQGKPKIRDIYYAAHFDRYIYQYYAHFLGVLYNQYVEKNNINECSVAYRTNLGKCNIDFSYEVFQFIKNNPGSIILIGDFTNFFDSLDHKELKKRLEVVIDGKLDNNLYKVFKSITKFNYVNIENIYDYLTKKRGKRSEKYYLRKIKRIMSLSEFREFLRNNDTIKGGKVLKKNNNDFGIVQGSPLSGLFANIYMIEFDKLMKILADKYNGLYLRYSDDFVIVLCGVNDNEIEPIYANIQNHIEVTKNIELKKEKTNIYRYNNDKITCLNEEIFNTTNTSEIIKFLGFSFDGKKMRIREKTLSKFYYRMHRAVKYLKLKNKGTLKKLFDKFTIQGESKGNGNFINYVKRAMKIYSNELEIIKVRRNSKNKLKQTLNKKKFFLFF